jgi:hypothetical protein
MEVHHHPEMHQHKKRFSAYFLEFLMIFLAVTMGFIAENIREHFTERSKEKQYIIGFIRDLRDDTSNLQHVIKFDVKQIKGLDSMLQLAHANISTGSNLKLFYDMAFKYLYSSATFRSNDATLQELKSTGDYRLMEKDHVADSLSKYDAEIRGIYEQGDYYKSYFKEILSRLDDLTDLTVLTDTSYMKKGKLTNKPLPPLRNDGNKLPTFFNKVLAFREITDSYAEYNLKPQLDQAVSLLNYLKKEYDLNDDAGEQ